LLATAAYSGEVLHSRLRGGSATSGRGSARFLAETLRRVRRAGASGPLVVRADAGFYSHQVVETCRKHGARFSITVRMDRKLWSAIAGIPARAWAPIPYWLEGTADVAETYYLPFAHRPGAKPVRLIVRRVQPHPGTQLQLAGVLYSYHAFITDREGDCRALEADHRQHAVVEQTVRDLKEGVGLNHLPSGRFGANAAWLAFAVFAHNLARWVSRLGLHDATLTTATLRRRFFGVPARIVCSARQVRLRLPTFWPWRAAFLQILIRLRAISLMPLRA
jgi:hypothetical protein